MINLTPSLVAHNILMVPSFLRMWILLWFYSVE